MSLTWKQAHDRLEQDKRICKLTNKPATRYVNVLDKHARLQWQFALFINGQGDARPVSVRSRIGGIRYSIEA